MFWEKTSQSLPNNWSIQALPSYILLSKWEGGGHMYWKDIMAIWEKGLGKYRHPQRFHGYSFHHETCFLRRIQWRSLRKKGRHSLRIWWTTCITWWQLCSFWFSIEKKKPSLFTWIECADMQSDSHGLIDYLYNIKYSFDHNFSLVSFNYTYKRC